MLPEEIPYGYYTHLNFAFATIDPQSFEIVPGDSKTDSFMKRIGAIKSIQPDIEIWVAVGGWAFNDPGATQWVFSDMAASQEKTNAFIDSLIKMMNKYGFEGVDIDWYVYHGCLCFLLIYCYFSCWLTYYRIFQGVSGSRRTQWARRRLRQLRHLLAATTQEA